MEFFPGNMVGKQLPFLFISFLTRATPDRSKLLILDFFGPRIPYFNTLTWIAEGSCKTSVLLVFDFEHLAQTSSSDHSRLDRVFLIPSVPSNFYTAEANLIF